MVYYIMFLGTHEPFSKNRQKHSKNLWHHQEMVLIYRSYRWDNSQVNTSKKLLKSCWQEVRLVLIYRSCHVVTASTLKTKQRHTKNVRVIEETWWTTNNSAADKLGKKQASKEMSQQDLWNFSWEFDPGSGRTLAACLIHASRTNRDWVLALGQGEWRTGE